MESKKKKKKAGTDDLISKAEIDTDIENTCMDAKGEERMG